MYCEKCGKPVEGEGTLCSNCAAQETTVLHEDAPAQPLWSEAEETTILNEPAANPHATAAPVADTFVLNTANTANTAPVKKASKKKKIGLIAGIAAVVVAAIVAVGFVFWDYIDAFTGRTFKQPEVYLADVEMEAITAYTDQITQSYGAMLANYNTQKTAGNAEIALTLGDGVLTLVESALEQQGVEMDLDWLSQVKLSLNTNVQDDAMQVGMGVGLSKGNLLSLDAIFDIRDGMFYVAIPEFNDDYLSVDMSSEIPMDELEGYLSMSTEMGDALVKALPSEEELNELINTYVGIVLAGIEDVERETETVTVGDASQKMVILTAKIDQEDLLDIAEDILKKAEKDKNLKKIINAMGDAVNEMAEISGGPTVPGDLYDQFVNAIPYALDAIEEAKDNADDENYIELAVYVDMKNNVRGHEITIYSGGHKVGDTLSWLTAATGDTTYTEAELAAVKITGEKVEKKGVSEGSYVLEVEGEKIGTLKFANVTETSGTLQLIPGEAIMEQILSGSNIPAGLLGDKLALELVYDSQENSSSFAVNILAGSNTLVGISLSGGASEGGKISIPSSAVNVENSNELMQWLKSADFDGILNAMENAGVPDDIVDDAASYVDRLMSYMN